MRIDSLGGKAVGIILLLVVQIEGIQAFCGPFPLRTVDTSGYIKPSKSTVNAHETTNLRSSLSDDGDFALIGLNADAPLDTFEVRQTRASVSSFGLKSADDIMASASALANDYQTTASSRKEALYIKKSSPQVSAMGLTENGDFIIEGVNAIDPTVNQGLEKYGTPLIDPTQGELSEGDLLSQLSLTPPQQESTSGWGDNQAKTDNLNSLTEDGDVVMVGFNTAQPTSSYTNPDQVDQTELLASLQQRQTPNIFSPPESSMEEVEDMTMWLQDIIPTLRDDDCIFYAEQLVSLGFHPDCVTQSELCLEDLGFMKPLHSRFVFKTIHGEQEQDGQ